MASQRYTAALLHTAISFNVPCSLSCSLPNPSFQMSLSVSQRSPMGRHASNSKHSVSPVRGRGSPRRRSRFPDGSPHRSSLSRRERSPAHRKSAHRGSSLTIEKYPSRAKSPKREKASSPVSKSSSPRTKRLRIAEAEREDEKAIEREHKRNHGKGSDKVKHRERDPDKEVPKDRRERRSEKDAADDDPHISTHRRSASPLVHHHRSRHHSRSPSKASSSRARDEAMNSRGSDHRDDGNDSVAKMKATEEALEAKQKQKPSFELSGKLAAETNRVRGITLLFTEPPDARKPDIRWRLYVFKAGEVLNEPLYVHRQSCYLFGRERRIADIPTDHPSCSKQHAVLQFRQVEKEQPDGTISKQARPYLMDLGSTNKTFINDNPIEPQRYYELFEKDTIKFGNSSREYVLLHENSAG
ncbi:hypothetical protein Nepgr_026180 [Nepenthes gracilis]|uniref:FHA domain-containing protein n=1 Tax=Nepenthes gracilis TaxID=150966 RepID=A0AAD3T7S0_NEPGR|nr:hypothetical protein Nepgr_026180 [Nepenthes gracilis]